MFTCKNSFNTVIKYFVIFFIVTGLFSNFRLSAQCNWELKKETKDIQVYTCKKPESPFKAFQVHAVFETKNIASIAAAILDVENYVNWMPDAEEAVVIKKFTDGHDIHYIRTGAPWPVDDRDGVYEQQAVYLKDKNRVVIEINALKGYDYPEKDKVVRMISGSGFWEITKAGSGKFKLFYEYFPNPGGNVPAWLVNASVVKIPFKMMENLKKIVEKGAYDDAQLDFMN
jgi:hypothetical protein